MPIRTLVDGVDFRQVFMFPRLLGAVTASMQPPRLVVGVLLVAALMSIGRTYDAVRGPTVEPAGLLAPVSSDRDLAAANDRLRAILLEYVPEAERPDGWSTVRLSAVDVARRAERAYRAARAERAADGSGAAWEAIAEADARFVAAMRDADAVRRKGTFEAVEDASLDAVSEIVRGTLTLRLDRVFDAFADLFVRMPVAAWRADPFFTLGYGLAFLALTALFGGALARMAACDVARREKLRVVDGLAFALATWRDLLLAPLLPLVLAGVLAGVIVLLGVLMTVPVLDVVGGALYGLVLVLGFFVAFLLLGYAASFPLLVPAVVSERCDAGEAQQRAFAYLLARPLHLAGYMALGIAGFAVGYVVVAGVATVTLDVSAALFGALTTNTAATALGGFGLFDLDARAPEIHVGTSRPAAAFTGFWQTVVVALVAGWVFSYYYAATTRIYLLMRRTVDGEDPTEVWHPGLVPGTHVRVRGEAAVARAAPARSAGAVRAAMRGLAAVRGASRPFNVRTEATRAATDADEGVEFGPELVPEEDRRTGLSTPRERNDRDRKGGSEQGET